ncbi:S1C family serine protease [Caldisalinibacter kiritimatiensis]|uniref:Periplasmic protease n=1 Tax=Caldisalinibacter kiritimatiensis TaxID=1304284 RepID=R1CSE5_9FIRM|nr:trypsin-like peptidase domain-containing protein [Caldisalinibacter kiritimatiensis]EOD01576.1 periplasmic protease [Caldisalinibacter kiritimatiensis]
MGEAKDKSSKTTSNPYTLFIVAIILFIQGSIIVFTIDYLLDNYVNDKASAESIIKTENLLYTLSYSSKIKTTEEIAELKKGVVKIETPKTQGSGVIINQKGYVITNWHVIADSFNNIYIYFDEHNEIYVKADCIEYDKDLDVALLKIEEIPDWYNLNYITFGDSKNAFEGQKIVTIGSPQGLKNTVAEGIVSAIRKERDDFYIQITAPLSPGSSGGALLNDKGELIGITSFQQTKGENLNFAISSYNVMKFLDDISLDLELER